MEENNTQMQMTLYDMSKQIVANEPPMKPEDYHRKLINISNNIFGEFYMLLCHERRDYSIFKLGIDCLKTIFANELKETLDNRGDIIFIDEQPGKAWEIWIRDPQTKENFAYYLFNYDNGIIEVG